jgi:predicted PurR-regulated permease PerM
LRDKLPASIAGAIPDEIATVQTWLSGYLKSQASSLSHVGQSWLHGVLFAYVGLVIGALVSASHKEDKPIALRKQMRNRGQTLIDTFRQIIVAQLWIASFNATCTAVFLLAVLPAFGTHMPYASTLVLFTFLSSLIPVVGNLVCNSVLALTGVSVSPMVGLACLGFLMLIHKAEYIILSRTVGSRTNTATWELLAVLFIGEAVFGMAGLIAAPLMYAYVKKELQAERLV